MQTIPGMIVTVVLSALAVIGLGTIGMASEHDQWRIDAVPAVADVVVPDDAQVDPVRGPLMTIPADVVSPAMWDALKANGVTGSPFDGSDDVLYAHMSDAVGSCYTDTDCFVATHYFTQG